MKVAVLTNNEVSRPLIDWLRETGEDVEVISEKIDLHMLERIQPDLIVSYSYRYIIGEDVISAMNGGIINLHISYLPWNKGADPNIWSFLENTPKGVTIHKIDEGLDTGEILVQEELVFNEAEETLASSYEKLHEAMLDMFRANWKYLREKRIIPARQKKGGSCHKSADLDKYRHIIAEHGYTIPVKEFKRLCAEIK
ncbi:formyltransferase family protein [Geovibrio ferrireducens]|uniref:formyltransferase family protein n=1 Tax=Geovibrio ferrireducens TaxID=46201 RepID=UPI002248441C|nr:formyltransferase family protein [Geovibrio ferrireducens]